MEQRRHVATDSRTAARGCPTERRSGEVPDRGDPRQPVRQNDGPGGPKGYDAGKKIKGRKRHILVDSLGLILERRVHTADIQDRDGARIVLESLRDSWLGIRRIWADGGYAGELVGWVKRLREHLDVELEIVRRTDDMSGFKVLPRRWIVERTFGWLGRCRRLAKDFEFRIAHSEAMIDVAMISLMLRRLIPA